MTVVMEVLGYDGVGYDGRVGYNGRVGYDGRVDYNSGVAYDSGDIGVGYAGHVGYNGSDGGAAMMADMLAMMVANGGIGYDGRMKLLATTMVIEVLAMMAEMEVCTQCYKGTDQDEEEYRTIP